MHELSMVADAAAEARQQAPEAGRLEPKAGVGGAASLRGPFAPPPDTVVARPRREAEAEVRATVREEAMRAQHAAEIDRLAQALRRLRQEHAAEVERLRAEHAAEVQHLTETLWRLRDVLRAKGGEPPATSGGAEPPMEQETGGHRRQIAWQAWLARVVGPW